MEMASRFRGALLGLAVGDALGTTLEFKPPGSFKPINSIVGGGPFHLEPGQWTDDTSMALCLAESLSERQEFDPLDQMERYLRWYRHGHLSSTGTCFDCGGTTRVALERFERTHEPFSGPTEAKTAGNGSLMRLAPVPLFFSSHPERALEKSGEGSRTTHGAAAAVDACRYYGGMIVGSVRGASKQDLLSARYAPLLGYWQEHPLCPEIDNVAGGSFKERHPPEILGTGYVVNSLEAALWAFYRSSTFREGCLLAVNLGDDADTTGAIYGQLAGGYYGEQEIPAEWRAQISMRHVIETFADKLSELSQRAA